MIEIKGDFWKIEADLKCITTNGCINMYGDAVMGKGMALQAYQIFKPIAKTLGKLLQEKGNHVYDIGYGLVNFPTKYHFAQDSSIFLIVQSCKELLEYVNSHPTIEKVLLTQPGCGNGNLKWEEVKPILEQYFDNRFVVIFK